MEIAQAVLDLLADTPLDQLTTRQIAEHVRISQPALFRHFASRDAILLAAIDQGREQLGAVVQAALGVGAEPIAQLGALAAALLAHVEQHSGLARLLFSWPAPGPTQAALAHLVSMQTSLVAELVKRGQRRGVLASNVDAKHAASGFVGLIQATVLRRQLFGGAADPAHEARALLELWLHGVASGDAAAVDVSTEGTEALLALDVRPILAGGEDPLARILECVERLRPGGVLCLTAPFEPRPLLTLLETRGHHVRVRQLDDCWAVDVCQGEALVDLSELEAPEPLERILEAEARLAPGELFVAHVPRTPTLLFPHLRERGVQWLTHLYPDESALVCLWR